MFLRFCASCRLIERYLAKAVSPKSVRIWPLRSLRVAIHVASHVGFSRLAVHRKATWNVRVIHLWSHRVVTMRMGGSDALVLSCFSRLKNCVIFFTKSFSFLSI